MGHDSEMAKKKAAKMLAQDPDYFRKLAAKSQESWVKGGRKPRGFAVRKDVASQAGKVSRKRKET